MDDATLQQLAQMWGADPSTWAQSLALAAQPPPQPPIGYQGVTMPQQPAVGENGVPYAAWGGWAPPPPTPGFNDTLSAEAAREDQRYRVRQQGVGEEQTNPVGMLFGAPLSLGQVQPSAPAPYDYADALLEKGKNVSTQSLIESGAKEAEAQRYRDSRWLGSPWEPSIDHERFAVKSKKEQRDIGKDIDAAWAYTLPGVGPMIAASETGKHAALTGNDLYEGKYGSAGEHAATMALNAMMLAPGARIASEAVIPKAVSSITKAPVEEAAGIWGGPPRSLSTKDLLKGVDEPAGLNNYPVEAPTTRPSYMATPEEIAAQTRTPEQMAAEKEARQQALFGNGGKGYEWPDYDKALPGRQPKPAYGQPPDPFVPDRAMGTQLHTFIGPEGGKDAESLIKYAKGLDAAGWDRDKIWQETARRSKSVDPNTELVGAFQGADGEWRAELHDGRLHVETNGKTGETTADFPHITERYPKGPQNANVMTGPWLTSPQGGYTPGLEPYAYGKSDAIVKPVLGHELQHVAQTQEGFAPGSAPGTVRAKDPRVDDLAGTYYAEMQAKAANAKDDGWASAGALSKDDMWANARNRASYDIYRRGIGETEARNVGSRVNMTRDERVATPPWMTQDVPDFRQLVPEFKGGVQESRAGWTDNRPLSERLPSRGPTPHERMEQWENPAIRAVVERDKAADAAHQEWKTSNHEEKDEVLHSMLQKIDADYHDKIAAYNKAGLPVEERPTVSGDEKATRQKWEQINPDYANMSAREKATFRALHRDSMRGTVEERSKAFHARERAAQWVAKNRPNKQGATNDR